MSEFADRHLETLGGIHAREKLRAFEWRRSLRPYNYSSGVVGTEISDRNDVGLDDKIEILRTEQRNPFVPLKTRSNACRIYGTRREGRVRQGKNESCAGCGIGGLESGLKDHLK